jgi:hypothetical protein
MEIVDPSSLTFEQCLVVVVGITDEYVVFVIAEKTHAASWTEVADGPGFIQPYTITVSLCLAWDLSNQLA